MTTIPGPTLADFDAARERVGMVVAVTPMESSRFLAEILGSPVHLKCENLQRMPGTPIKLIWSREEDMLHGKFHPVSQPKRHSD